VKLSTGEPLLLEGAEPLVLKIDSTDSRKEHLEILVPSSNGLVVAVSSDGKLLGKDKGFPISLGTFEYIDSLSRPAPLYLYAAKASAGVNLYGMQRKTLNGIHLPKAALSDAGWSLPGHDETRSRTLDASLLKTPEAAQERQEVDEFFVFPSPLRGGTGNVRLRLGASAEYAQIEFFDITGNRSFTQKFSNPAPVAGSNEWRSLDFSNLGSDVYTVRLTVQFADKKVVKWTRVGVVK
jgi:hypothetical protein